MGLMLDNWQKEVLDYSGDILLCTGRRVGKTYVLARKAIDYMASHPKTPIVIISLTEDQAMIIMTMALYYAQETYPRLIGKGKFKPTLKTLWLNNGKMIIRPVGNTGSGARGFEGGILIVDEAAHMPKSFWNAAKPILLTTNGKIWMSSTPFGENGYFWERYKEAVIDKEPKARFRVWEISSEEVMKNRAISPSWTLEQREGALRILEQDKREMSWREYAQEYLGKFISALSRFFSDEIIEKCCILKRPETIIKEYKFYMGCDLARMGGDECTFEIIQKISKDNFIQIENLITKKVLTTETEQKIMELHKIYNFRKVGLDAGAGTLGVSILDHLLKETIGSRLVALNNRARSLDKDDKTKTRLQKEDFYNNLLSMMESGKLQLLDDDEIKMSLRSVQYEYLSEENKQSRLNIFSTYGHIVEGIHRAVWLATEDKTLNIWAC